MTVWILETHCDYKLPQVFLEKYHSLISMYVLIVLMSQNHEPPLNPRHTLTCNTGEGLSQSLAALDGHRQADHFNEGQDEGYLGGRNDDEYSERR